jgi:hypothetical protein
MHPFLDLAIIIVALAIAAFSIFVLFRASRISQSTILKAEYVNSLGLFFRKILLRLDQIKTNNPSGKLQIWFVLNEINEAKDLGSGRGNIYYDFILSILEMGFGIVYASDREEVILQVQTLRSGIDSFGKGQYASQISSRQLQRFPGADNLCFVTVNGSMVTGFSGYRSGRETVGGTELSSSEAESEWAGLTEVLND